MPPSLTLLDHLVTMLLVGVFPIYGAWAFRKLRRGLEAGHRGALVREYIETLAWQWGLTVVTIVWWAVRHRPWPDLGVSATVGSGFYLATAFVLIVIAGFVVQWRKVAGSERYRAAVQEALGSLVSLLPHNRQELFWFRALSVTAGICEELLYRGFLIWYLSQFTSLWMAVVISSLLFGYAHFYQGVAGMMKTGIAGLVAAGLYVLSGSLWLPMILHAATDFIQGQTAYAALRDSELVGTPVEA